MMGAAPIPRPPFTEETAPLKVKAAEEAWNSHADGILCHKPCTVSGVKLALALEADFEALT